MEDGTIVGDPATVEFTEVSYLRFIAVPPCKAAPFFGA